MDQYFERLLAMSQDYGSMSDFITFCKTIHDFVQCDTENCQVKFFIDMLVLYFKKNESIERKKERFVLSIV